MNSYCHQCSSCRHGISLEDRYDQVHCVSPASPEYGGNVEATSTCDLFEPTKSDLLKLLYLFSPRQWDLDQREFDCIETLIDNETITTFEELAEYGIKHPSEQ